MKTAELTGVALDWAVCKAKGEYQCPVDEYTAVWMTNRRYSTNWAVGGPVIEREEISISREFAASKVEWAAWTPAPIRDDAEAFGYGSTPLIAAMRCYVASKLGDEVEVPEELT
jgi:hypothetical protein